jgi:enoyl-CoA hydratase/carnithine racemase
MFDLHPDGFEASDSGWLPILKRFAAEAWRRAEAGEITGAELYPSDAQWCGLYDRMFPHSADEMERRLALAADYGEAV